ncbi:MAG: sulfite oxidase heme-binding subunit YedZ [Pseudorhodoplanes sp.]
MRASYQIWRDRRGRLSALRVGALAALLLPLAFAVHDASSNGLGARPLNDLIHRTGYWALIFLLVSLAVTPLRRIGRFGQLVDVRRMVGVGAFVYAAAHLGLYVADQGFDLWKVATEIALRLYLTIGFVAWIGLAVLAATSTDAMTKRLGGRNWRRLHQAAYVIALLALVHYFQQTKADVTVPTFTAGLFGWLMGYRFITWWSRTDRELSPFALALLSLGICMLTFAAETLGISLVFGAPPFAVLQTAFDFDGAIRPGWLVLLAGFAVVLLDLVRSRQRDRSGRRHRPDRPLAVPRQETTTLR